MHFRIQIVAVSEEGTEHCQEIADLVRSKASLETLGLTLNESKQILHDLQQSIVLHQVNAFLTEQRSCPHCQKPRLIKDNGIAVLRTLFGEMTLPNPRWCHCSCSRQERRTLRPLSSLLPERTSPELLFMESKWASLISYGLTIKLLQDFLPIDHKHSAPTVRNHLFRLAERHEAAMDEEKVFFMEGCQAERDCLPIPDGPLSVGLDGGIVRARRGATGEKTANLFEVIAGKSILSFRRDDPEEVPPSSKCFALVQIVDKKPKRRLFDLLLSQGMQANQQVTFFSDGGDNVRRLPEFLNPDSEHILDWFHITMRLTVLGQCARGLQQPAAADAANEEASLERCLESVKHSLWHGNSGLARDRLGDVEATLEMWDFDEDGIHTPRKDSESASRMLKYVRELDIYIRNNTGYIVNYGERYRCGERISTGFVESTINQVVSKRMVKKQQMQWTPKGAHLLLQVRTQVINGDWAETFRGWYPGFQPGNAVISASELLAA